MDLTWDTQSCAFQKLEESEHPQTRKTAPATFLVEDRVPDRAGSFASRI